MSLLPFAILLPIASSVALLWLIWTHTHRVPYLDEWETVRIIRHYRDGDLIPLDFYHFHNEHRLIIPRAIHLVLIELTGWNRQLEMSFNLAIALATLALFWDSARREGGARVAAIVLIPFSLLVLSFAQYENLLFAFQTNYLLAVFGGACCLWGLLAPASPTSRSRFQFAVALAGGIVATLSTFAGIVTWIAFAPVVWVRGRLRFAIWCATAVAIIIAYTNGISEVSGGTLGLAMRAIAADPTLPFRYMLAILGAPLGYPSGVGAQVAAALGLLILAVNLLAARRMGLRPPSVAWGGLALYGLGCCGVTLLGRAQGGIEFALTSRYQTFSSPWWIAALGIVALIGRQLPRRGGPDGRAGALPRLNRVAYLATIVGLLSANAFGWRDALRWPPAPLASEACVVNYWSSSDECLDPFFPTAPWYVRIGADYLRQERLAVFSGPTAPPAPPARRLAARPGGYDPERLRPEAVTTALGVDGIGDLSDPQVPPAPLVVAPSGTLVLTGWAVDVLGFRPADGLFVTLDNGTIIRAEYGARHPHAARLLGRQYLNSGYRLTIPGAALAPGEHRATLSIVAADGVGVYTPYHQLRVIVR